MAIDAQIAADQRGGGKIEDFVVPPAQQAHGPGGASGINDVDARVQEAMEADVHIAGTHGQEAIHTGAAAIEIGVIILECQAIAASATTDEIGVAIVAAIQPVIAPGAVKNIHSCPSEEAVSPPVAIEKIVAGKGFNPVLTAVGHHLLGCLAAQDDIVVPAAIDDATAIEEIIDPARNVAQGGIGVAVFIDKVVVDDGET